jgi:hypothetical protein
VPSRLLFEFFVCGLCALGVVGFDFAPMALAQILAQFVADVKQTAWPTVSILLWHRMN